MNLLKTVPGGKFSMTDMKWTFPLAIHHQLRVYNFLSSYECVILVGDVDPASNCSNTTSQPHPCHHAAAGE